MRHIAVSTKISTSRILGRVAGGDGPVQQLTGTQATTLLDAFTSALKGLVPPSGGGSTNYLRADGGWHTPPGHSGIYYNVLDYGLVADGTTDNKAALKALLDGLIAGAIGGTVYFPAGTYHFAIGGPGARTTYVFEGTEAGGSGNLNIRFLGDGRSTVITWGGDAGGSDAHFVQFANGCRYFTCESMLLMQKDAITNPDPTELHHFFSFATKLHGNNEYFRFVNVDFGLIKGDAINIGGGIDPGACVPARSGFAATLAAGAMSGPFVSPRAPQRVVIGYPAQLSTGKTTVNVVAAAGTFTRKTGSYVADGFAAGQTVTWTGFANPGNNATKIIQRVTTRVLTVTDVAGLVDESGAEDHEMAVGPDWDGGSFTVDGTDKQDNAIRETIPAGINDRYISVREFKTVTGVTKNGDAGLCTQKASVGYAFVSQFITIDHCTFNGYLYAGTNPDYGYRSCVGVQRLSSNVHVTRCFMTGSGDQLIDFEPTGNGWLGPWIIEGNTLIVSNPKSGSGGGALACTFYGNGNTTTGGSLLLEASSFSFNRVLGRLKTAKLSQCQILHNIIIADDGDSPEGVLTLVDTITDVDVIGNIIVTKPTTISRPVHVSGSDPYYAKGLRLNGNTIYWYDRIAMFLEGSNIECVGNRFVFLADTHTNDVAILYQGHANGQERIAIDGNTIEGGRGGGKLGTGVQYNPGTAATAVLSVSRNKGTDCKSIGVTLGTESGGYYKTIPVVIGNDFPDAATALFLEPGVVACIGGNPGGAAQYTSANTDPASDRELDSAGLGSTHQSTGPGGNLHLKTAAGPGGWKAVTHA